VASDGSLYVSENRGNRLVKLSASGTQLWTVGEPGVYGYDDEHFGSFWAGPEGNLAIDSSGNVYIADTGNARVQIFDSSGTLVGTFGSYGAAAISSTARRGSPSTRPTAISSSSIAATSVSRSTTAIVSTRRPSGRPVRSAQTTTTSTGPGAWL